MGGAELVEVVDADGNVVDVVTRAEMRAGRLRHRAVAVVVRRPVDGAVLVHRRAAWKDVWPSYWDVAFGGVCEVGESWIDAARRELEEEVGVTTELEPIGRGTYADDDVDLVSEVFEVRTEGPFVFADGEVTEVAWVPAAEIERWAAERDVCPDSLELARATWLRGPTVA